MDTTLDIEDQDWPKKTWDLWVMEDGMMLIVNTLPQLLDSLNVTDASVDEQRAEVANFTELPVWKSAPKTLVTEVSAWLRSSR